MNRFSAIPSLLISLALLTACTSNPRVQSSHDDSLDMSAYQTYNFSSRTEIENPDLPDTLELYFSAAVEKQLLSKGFVKSDKPDVLINVSVDLEEVTSAPVRARNCPRYSDYYSRRYADRYDGEGRRPMCIYSEGSIVVELVDQEQTRTIWEGVSRVRMDEKDRGASLAQNVTEDVAEMFGEKPFRGGNPVFLSGGIYN